MKQRPWFSPGNQSPKICPVSHNSVCVHIYTGEVLSFPNVNSMSPPFPSSQTLRGHSQVYCLSPMSWGCVESIIWYISDRFGCVLLPTVENKLPTVRVHEGLLSSSPPCGSGSVSWVVWAKATAGICLDTVTREVSLGTHFSCQEDCSPSFPAQETFFCSK